MIIPRPKEIARIKNLKKWVLLYGRRKTGKTFLVRNFIPHQEYFFVKGDKGILTKDNESISYETFVEVLRRSLEQNQTVVVDEFHRLGNEFFDLLHFMKKSGKLILISSTLFLSKRLISSKSALLGLFAEVPLGLLSLEDTLRSLKNFSFPKKERLELAILLREPLSIDFVGKGVKARKVIATMVISSVRTIPALIGEIFVEEEREISYVYEGILRAIAVGKVGSGEISSQLFSKKIIKKDDPSIIQQYLNNLVQFGIIRRIEIYHKKRFVYKISSPLVRTFYYIDERYNLQERKTSEKELQDIIDELMPRIVEDTVRESLAEKLGLRESVIEEGDYEIDACLLRFDKPEVVIEVKWKKVSLPEVKRAEENLSRVAAKRKILFVPNKQTVASQLTVWDVDDV